MTPGHHRTSCWFALALLAFAAAAAALGGGSGSCHREDRKLFRLAVAGRLPPVEAVEAMALNVNLGQCADLCLRRLGSRCGDMGYHQQRGECRLYPNPQTPHGHLDLAPGFTFFQGPKMADDLCQTTADCSTSHANCLQGRCRCMPGFYPHPETKACEATPQGCKTLRSLGISTSGKYSLELQDGGPLLTAYCDMDTDGGGWTVFQRRQDGSVNFTQSWQGYKQGFGNVTGEFWLGNDHLHRLTAAGLRGLRVDLRDWNNRTSFAFYNHFTVGDEQSNYKMEVTFLDGPTGDILSDDNGASFSTPDRDHSRNGCARIKSAGWWYHGFCWESTLNGRYGGRNDYDFRFITWYPWTKLQSLPFTEMKLR